MTVTSTSPPRKPYVGNGTGPYPITFPFDDKEDIVVTYVDVDGNLAVLTYISDYTISDPPSSQVTTVASYAATEKIVLTRATDRTQETDLKENRAYSAELYEAALDKLTYLIQEFEEVLTRQPAVNVDAPEGFDGTLPGITPGGAIGYNATGDGFAIVYDVTAVIDPFWQDILSTQSAAAALVEFGWLDIVNAWTAQNYMGKSTLTITAGAATIDYDSNPECELTLNEDCHLEAFTNPAHGKCVSLKVIQDGGGNDLTFDSSIDFASQDSQVNLTDTGVTWYRFWSDGTKTFAAKVWEDD